jgi:adenylate cyclase
MRKFLTRNAQWIIAAFGFLVFGLTQTHWLTNSDLWQWAEDKFIDRRYTLRAEKPPDPNIQLLGVQASSMTLSALNPREIAASPILQLMQQPWPWDRRVHAAILEKLMKAGAKVVMFDFVFAGKSDGDNVFAQDLLRYKNHVTIGAMFTQPQRETDLKKAPIGTYTPPNQRLLLPGTKGIVGLVDLWPDLDGVTRRTEYLTSIEREAGKPELETKFPEDKLIHITALTAEKFAGHVNLPPIGTHNFINFQRHGGTYQALPVEDLFVKELWEAPPFNGGIIFSNKIVIVGPMAPIFQDMHATPLGDMPGPEVQAQIIASLLSGDLLKESSPSFNAALTLCMVGLALFICLRIKNAPLKALLLVIATVFFLVAAQIVFNCNLVLAMTPPLFGLVVTGSFGVLFQYTLEQFERLRYRNILGRYVSENVAKTVLADTRSFEESLRGRKQAVTILFSDIRGFTSMTETSDAVKLVAQLNEYFAEMVDIIQEKNRGTLQKFIGDAIMAAWGDTHSEGLAEDAQHAVTAALQMRPALAKLNESWQQNPDRKKLSIGIGVNHGDVIVGNIGSQNRTEFTVLGDGVNLASRLESATKQFHTDILVGEDVEALTRGQFIYRSVDLLTVKGKTKPVEVFALLSDRSLPPPQWLEKYHEAIQLYRHRKFAEAANCFETVRKEIGVKDFLCEMYIERCEIYTEQPPPENWDGSYTLTEK